MIGDLDLVRETETDDHIVTATEVHAIRAAEIGTRATDRLRRRAATDVHVPDPAAVLSRDATGTVTGAATETHAEIGIGTETGEIGTVTNGTSFD